MPPSSSCNQPGTVLALVQSTDLEQGRQRVGPVVSGHQLLPRLGCAPAVARRQVAHARRPGDALQQAVEGSPSSVDIIVHVL